MLLTVILKEALATAADIDKLALQQPAAVAACLQAEKDRTRLLEELLAGWHAAIWGPHHEALVRNAERLSKAKALQGRAQGVVNQAWKETVQLAAETLGSSLSLGDVSE
ncbi:unnamed protein product, partial [Polarella glacialis]